MATNVEPKGKQCYCRACDTMFADIIEFDAHRKAKRCRT